MKVHKIAAFSNGNQGGNPAGVVLSDQDLPDEQIMQSVAAEVGFSETVFAAKRESEQDWRVRYFSPESEVPFCGHATIALGAMLAKSYGQSEYTLQLNNAQITVAGESDNSLFKATLQSPPTKSEALNHDDIQQTLALFGYQTGQLDDVLPPAFIHGGADHYFFAVNSKQDLSAMDYDLEKGREFMRQKNIVTIMFCYRESDNLFHIRNAFASGGVLEDPATGAAAAAFSGYLRDIDWPSDGNIEIIQGEDMGYPSRIFTQFDSIKGSSIRVTGQAREME